MTDVVKRHPGYASVLVAIVVYALLGFLVAPYLLHKTLVQTMRQDYNAELRVEKIEINPFSLSLRINGLELDNPAGQPTARVQEIFANFQLSSIFRLALTFDEIRFSKPELFVTRDNSGDMDFAYLVKPGDSQSDGEADESDQDSSLLQALIFRFRIEDCFINWSDQFVPEPVITRFGPITIDIKELNTLPDRPGQQNVVIITENSGTLSWTGELQLNPLRSSGHAVLKESHFPLVSAYVRHRTGVDIVDGSADVDLEYEIHTTNTGQLEARVENFNLTFTDLTVNSFADGTGFDFAGPDQQILRVPVARLADGRFQWPEQSISLGSITIDNPQIDVSRDKNGVFNIEPGQARAAEKIEAADNLADAGADGDAGAGAGAGENAPGESANQWQLAIGNLSINGLVLDLLDQTVIPAATLGVTDFNLSVDDISNQPNRRFPTSLSLQASSGGRLSLKGEVAILPQPMFEFDVNLDSVQLAGVHPYIKQRANLNMNSGAINLDGHISGTAEEPFSFDGDLNIVDLDVAESINNERLASWKSFHADKIAFSLASRQLDISSFRFDELYGDILIDANGNLNVGQVAKADADKATGSMTPATEAETTTEAEPGEPKFPLKTRIGRIVLENASADFRDLALPLPFAAKIDGLNGKMTTISTESSEPSEVLFEGKVDEFGLARITGTVTPLKPTDNTNLLVSFENIDVPKFTPYSIPFAGREIASGKLDLKLGYKVNNSQLISENNIVLRDFELGRKVPHPNALDLPLGLAVALLKDANGKIDIDLPVRGDVNAPDFNYGGVIMSALGDLLVKIVLSPFAALGKLLGIESSELESVKFLDGRSDLSPPEMEKTMKLAEALSLRPELQLVITGIFDAEKDGLALRTAELNRILDQRITDLAAASDPAIQYADLRRMALEKLFIEPRDAAAAAQELEQLRTKFTTQVAVEGQTEPSLRFDSLAYASELHEQLIASRVIDENALNGLANARAEALKTALLGMDENLHNRISIAENAAIEGKHGEPIEMKVKLGSMSD